VALSNALSRFMEIYVAPFDASENPQGSLEGGSSRQDPPLQRTFFKGGGQKGSQKQKGGKIERLQDQNVDSRRAPLLPKERAGRWKSGNERHFVSESRRPRRRKVLGDP